MSDIIKNNENIQIQNNEIEQNHNQDQDQSESRISRPFFRNKFLKRKKQCSFCIDRINKIDYKEAMRLRKYISERAKILPRRVTGMCAYHQRILARAIKRARFLALIPCTNA